MTTLDGKDVRRTRGGVPLSGHEKALIDQARGEMPQAQYWREAILAAAAEDLGIPLDDMDTARRPAARRPNYKRKREETT